MTYKEFKKFCNDRACDGYWCAEDAVLCIQTLQVMKRTPIWKRKEVWKEFEPIITEWKKMWDSMMQRKGLL